MVRASRAEHTVTPVENAKKKISLCSRITGVFNSYFILFIDTAVSLRPAWATLEVVLKEQQSPFCQHDCPVLWAHSLTCGSCLVFFLSKIFINYRL